MLRLVVLFILACLVSSSLGFGFGGRRGQPRRGGDGPDRGQYRNRCSRGSTWDSAKQACVPNKEEVKEEADKLRRCPNGSRRDSAGDCVPTKCGPNEHLVNKQCKRICRSDLEKIHEYSKTWGGSGYVVQNEEWRLRGGSRYFNGWQRNALPC